MRKLLLLGALSVLLPGGYAIAQAPGDCLGVDVNDHRATDSSDFLSGSTDRDVIALGEGGDQYFGGDGNDAICGNEGNDVLGGEIGADDLAGGSGDDLLAGIQGADNLWAGDGADTVDGGSGTDVLNASGADGDRDDLYDGLGADQIIGNEEDVWHRCADATADDRSGFAGTVVPNPDC